MSFPTLNKALGLILSPLENKTKAEIPRTYFGLVLCNFLFFVYAWVLAPIRMHACEGQHSTSGFIPWERAAFFCFLFFLFF